MLQANNSVSQLTTYKMLFTLEALLFECYIGSSEIKIKHTEDDFLT